MTKFKKWMSYHKDDIVDIVKRVLMILCISWALAFLALDIAYMMGHPEWMLSQDCVEMIVENVT